MRSEAERILAVFRVRELRAGSIIHIAQLSEAVGLKRGFVTDDIVRRALAQLFDCGYVIETRGGLELTSTGEAYIYGDIAS